MNYVNSNEQIHFIWVVSVSLISFVTSQGRLQDYFACYRNDFIEFHLNCGRPSDVLYIVDQYFGKVSATNSTCEHHSNDKCKNRQYTTFQTQCHLKKKCDYKEDILVHKRLAGCPGSANTLATYFYAKYKCAAAEEYLFRQKPPKLMKHVFGESTPITFPCTVEAEAEFITWTKGGNILGETRDLPDYPRYSITGDLGRGENFLKIINVEYSDEDTYECQAYFNMDNDKPPQRAASELFILVKPEAPFIMKDGRNVSARPHIGRALVRPLEDPIVLQCISKEGRPAPKLSWYQDGKHITRGVVSYVDKFLALKKETVTSVLTLNRTGFDFNGVIVECKAIHEALHTPPRARTRLIVLEFANGSSYQIAIWPSLIPAYEQSKIIVKAKYGSLQAISSISWTLHHKIFKTKKTFIVMTCIRRKTFQGPDGITATHDSTPPDCKKGSSVLTIPNANGHHNGDIWFEFTRTSKEYAGNKSEITVYNSPRRAKCEPSSVAPDKCFCSVMGSFNGLKLFYSDGNSTEYCKNGNLVPTDDKMPTYSQTCEIDNKQKKKFLFYVMIKDKDLVDVILEGPPCTGGVVQFVPDDPVDPTRIPDDRTYNISFALIVSVVVMFTLIGFLVLVVLWRRKKLHKFYKFSSTLKTRIQGTREGQRPPRSKGSNRSKTKERKVRIKSGVSHM